MHNVLLGKDYELDIPEDTPDDWPNSNCSYSWMKEGTFDLKKSCLFEEYLTTQEILYVNHQGQMLMKMSQLRKLLNKIAELNCLLCLLCYFTPGSVACVAEFVDHKISNADCPHNIFRDGGLIWAVTRHTKMENIV